MRAPLPHHSLIQALEAAGRIILGKEHQLRLALACLLARGHLLIEDLPGVGKTTLAHTLARLLGLDFQRIQFTSDMLPADIIGVSVFDRGKGSFQFHPGPIFAQLVLADEINRATPKTQSALLEAMEERQVTAEGATRQLPCFRCAARLHPGTGRLHAQFAAVAGRPLAARGAGAARGGARLGPARRPRPRPARGYPGRAAERRHPPPAAEL